MSKTLRKPKVQVDQQKRFSIRKYSLGVASVAIGLCLFGRTEALAEEVGSTTEAETVFADVAATNDSLASDSQSTEPIELSQPVSEEDDITGIVPVTIDENVSKNKKKELLSSTKVDYSSLFSVNNQTDKETLLKQEQKAAVSEAKGMWMANTTRDIEVEIKRQEALGLDQYVIQWGDTLGRIAQASNTTVAELARVNNISDPNLIITGKLLVGVLHQQQITTLSATDLLASEQKKALWSATNRWEANTPEEIAAEIKRQEGLNLSKYVIQWGDTLWGISKATGKTINHLVEVNHLENSNLIITGRTLDGVLSSAIGMNASDVYTGTNTSHSVGGDGGITPGKSEATNADMNTDGEGTLSESSTLPNSNPTINELSEEELKKRYQEQVDKTIKLMNQDSDNDGINDFEEMYYFKSNPNNNDSDGNGISDIDEDPDQDGIPTSEEIKLGTSSIMKDSDYDGISDKDEIEIYKTNPWVADTDGDGMRDNWEVTHQYDPLKANESFEVKVTSKDPLVHKVSLSGTTVAGGEYIDIYANNSHLLNDTIPGYYGKAASISLGALDIEKSSFSVSFDLSDLVLTDGSQPTIYGYNRKEQLLTELATTIKEGLAVTPYQKQFRDYMLLDKTTFSTAVTERSDNGVSSSVNDEQPRIAFRSFSLGSGVQPASRNQDSKLETNKQQETDLNGDGISNEDTRAIFNRKLKYRTTALAYLEAKRRANELKLKTDEEYEALLGGATNHQLEVLKDYRDKAQQKDLVQLWVKTGVISGDYDGDGAINGNETTIKYDSQGNKYLHMVSNPEIEDTDGDGQLDGKDEKPLAFDVTDDHLAVFAHRAYEKEDNDSLTKKLKYRFPTLFDDTKWMKQNGEYLHGKYDGGNFDANWYTYRNGDDEDIHIIGIRGTDDNFSKLIKSLTELPVTELLQDISIVTSVSPQVYSTLKLAQDVSRAVANTNQAVYTTGHSLGGHLAYWTGYYLDKHQPNNHKLALNINGPGYTDPRSRIKDIIERIREEKNGKLAFLLSGQSLHSKEVEVIFPEILEIIKDWDILNEYKTDSIKSKLRAHIRDAVHHFNWIDRNLSMLNFLSVNNHKSNRDLFGKTGDTISLIDAHDMKYVFNNVLEPIFEGETEIVGSYIDERYLKMVSPTRKFRNYGREGELRFSILGKNNGSELGEQFSLEQKHYKTITAIVNKNDYRPSIEKVHIDNEKISGKTIPFASIYTEKGKTNIQADEFGNFELVYSKNEKPSKIYAVKEKENYKNLKKSVVSKAYDMNNTDINSEKSLDKIRPFLNKIENELVSVMKGKLRHGATDLLYDDERVSNIAKDIVKATITDNISVSNGYNERVISYTVGRIFYESITKADSKIITPIENILKEYITKIYGNVANLDGKASKNSIENIRIGNVTFKSSDNKSIVKFTENTDDKTGVSYSVEHSGDSTFYSGIIEQIPNMVISVTRNGKNEDVEVGTRVMIQGRRRKRLFGDLYLKRDEYKGLVLYLPTFEGGYQEFVAKP